MKFEQIAIQLYTLRDYLKTPEDVDRTLGRVAAIGYPAVQISGMAPGVISEADMVALCKKHGLVVCATHEPGKDILENPTKVVARLKALGCKATAYPFPAGIDFTSEESISGLIRGLNDSGRVLAEAGLVLTYHNHHHEFRKLGGRLLLDRIYAETDPRYLQAEIDTYWVQYGGANPVEWCKRLAGRLPLLHLKDYKITNESTIAFAPIGEGNLDMPAIIEAADAAGCEWFIVEQDSCEGDPFEAIATSLAYLKTLAK